MYTIWRDRWSARQAQAEPRRREIEERIRAKNPADFADKMDMFRQGRRDVFGPEYELAANEADLCAAQLSVMDEVLQWLEARKAMGQRVTLDQVNKRALEEAEAKAIFVNIMMTALVVGHPSGMAGRGSASKVAPRAATPQGISDEAFAEMSRMVREGGSSLGDDIAAHGSRAAGTARPGSDLDIAIRVPPVRFEELVRQRFGNPNPGSAKLRTMQHALTSGKIQAGEAGLSGLRRQLEKLLGIPVDISVVRVGGPFDQGPFIQLK